MALPSRQAGHWLQLAPPPTPHLHPHLVRRCLFMPLWAGVEERGRCHGTFSDSCLIWARGKKGGFRWATSQQEKWLYPVWLGPQEPGPVHVGTCGATEWVLAATGLGVHPSQPWRERRQ